VRLRILIVVGVAALLALALLGVAFSTGRRLTALRRRVRPAVRFTQPAAQLVEQSI
jgi:hypothetical protein